MMRRGTFNARRLAATSAMLAAIAVAVPVAAQDPGSRQTREFVQAASQSDMFEILEARAALAQSANPQVRAFAQQMIQAHEQTAEQLRVVVAREGLRPPAPGVSGDQSMFLAALQSARGAEFDVSYAKQQILAHHAALAVEQAYAASGDDAAIRQLAAGAVSVISSHLEMAEQLRMQPGGS